MKKMLAMMILSVPGLYALHAGEEAQIVLAVRIVHSLPDTIPVKKLKDTATFDRTLDEAVITGLVKGSSVRDASVPIVRVTERQIDRTTESNLIDVLVRNVPGLQAVKTGPNISKPFIRGLGYHRVLTLYDGLRQEGQQWGDEHGIEVDPYAIERAEVIKGPASLMFGSDALAGVVSLFPSIPKPVDAHWHGKGVSEYQSNNGLIGNGLALERSLAHAYFGLRGSWRLAKSYQSPVDGRVYQTGFRETNLSALFGYRSDKTNIRLNLTLYNDRQSIPDGSRDSLSRRFTRQVNEGDQDTITSRPLVSDEALNTYANPDLSQLIRHYRAYLRAEHRVGEGSIEWTLGWQRNERAEFVHPTNPSLPGMSMQLNTINYALRYDLPSPGRWKTSIGFNGMGQENKNRAATDFPVPDHRLFDIGAYVHAKWTSGDWVVTGGLRQDLRIDRWSDLYVRKNSSTGFEQQVFQPDTAGASRRYTAFHRTFTGMSASLGLSWRTSDHVSLKVNIGRAYRAPNITELASNGLDPGAHIIYKGDKDFIPEFSWQEDIGLNLRYEGFTADLSLFNIHVDHYIYQALVVDGGGRPIVDAQGNRTYAYRQEAAQLHGAEWWSVVHPAGWRGFRFENNVSFVYGYNKGPAFQGKGLQGEFLPFIPPLKWLSSLSWVIRSGRDRSANFTPRIDLECAARQDRYLALHGTETATPGYALVHAGLTADMRLRSGLSLQWQLQVNNLFDAVYQSNLSRLKYFEYYSAAPNGRSGIYNMGRNVCVKLILGW